VEQEKPVIQHPQQLMEDQEVAVVVQEQLLIQEEQEILLQYLQHKVLLEEMVQYLQAQVVEAVEELQP
jgi:phage terminase small subunit